MSYQLSKEDREFRDSVRAFISRELPNDLRERLRQGYFASSEEIRSWQKKLAKAGWAAPSWPAAYGGPDWSPIRQYIFMSELFLAPAPEPFILNSNVAGPLIIKFGSDQQKERFLPGMLTLDIWFCVGMSEPNSGSDLASLRTKATRVAGGYVVNGQKVWTSTAHEANWMLAMVRTDQGARKHEGISILLIDMNLPGIEVRPIITLDGRHHFNEVFFRDVNVPEDCLLGDEGAGWAYARHGLTSERAGIARVGLLAERLDFLREHLASQPDAYWKGDLLRLAAETRALEAMTLEARTGAVRFPDSGYNSMLKLLGSELWKRACSLSNSHCGAESNLCDRDPYGLAANPDETGLASLYSYSQAATIYGGTTEIQKNIIFRATAGLTR